jgi:hypothetical protein
MRAVAIMAAEAVLAMAISGATTAKAGTMVPNDWAVEAQHCSNSPSDTTVHSRGFALAYRQWGCVNGHVYVCDPVGTNADCSIAEYWTSIERDADEVQREQSEQAAQQAQRVKDDYLSNARTMVGFHLNLVGTAYRGPEWSGKFRIHITPDGRIDSIRVLAGERNLSFLRQLQFQLSQINLGAPPPGCDVIDTGVGQGQ